MKELKQINFGYNIFDFGCLDEFDEMDYNFTCNPLSESFGKDIAESISSCFDCLAEKMNHNVKK